LCYFWFCGDVGNLFRPTFCTLAFMPVYVYQGLESGQTFSLEQRIVEAALTHHPETGEPVKRLIGKPAIAFKGSGFYANDSKGASGSTKSTEPAKADSSSESSEPAKADSSSQTSSESTAESSPKAESKPPEVFAVKD
jgi:predicted nucleic acid-binding Zn ribbon protein